MLIEKFGNPTKEYLLKIKEENYLDSLLTELKANPFPEDSKEEVSEMIDAVNNLYTDPEARNRFKKYDIDFEGYIIQVLSQKVSKEDVVKLINEINLDISPLLIKLKYHYQRIRPTQYAILNDMPLYPYTSESANTPSYPSGHTFQAKVFCEVLGNKYPQYYYALQSLADDISISRFYMGLHYPSDIEFAKYCAEVVCNHPDFKKKYKL